MNINIDKDAIEQAVTDAIVQSAIGDKIKKAVDDALAKSYDNPLDKAIEQVVRDAALRYLASNYRAQIEAAVKARMTDEVINKTVDAMWATCLERWQR